MEEATLLLDKQKIIHNSQEVKDLVLQNRQKSVSSQLITNVFREDLGLKYNWSKEYHIMQIQKSL